MIAIAKLRKAVEEALAYLRTVEDIEEAEAFAASNGNLLTRLNYTSNIPSNGVEEPKSTESYGLGLQVVFKSEAGLKIGFGSEPSDLTLDGVRSALDKARRGAVLDPEFRSLARPTGERRTLRRYHDPRLMRLGDTSLVEAGWQVVNEGLEVFQTSESLALAAGGHHRIGELGLILGGDVSVLQERIAVGSYAMPRVQSDESTLAMSFLTAMVEGKESKGSGWSTGMSLRDFRGEAGREAAQNAIASMEGQRVRDGQYTVILGKQPVTDLMNNLVLPSLNLGNIYAASSAFMGKLGKPVAWEGLSIYDHGALPGYMGSKGITCEGLPTGRTDLVRDGVMVGTLANYYESQRILTDAQASAKLGADPREHLSAFVPRNGFRFSRGGGRHFGSPPGIFPTNIFIEGKDAEPLESLIARVQDGLFIGRIWYTYPINGLRAGDFTATVVGDSYIIKDGRLAAPLKPNTVRINDNIHSILGDIIGVSRQARGTLVWAADEVVYAPEIAVRGVHISEIAGFMETI